jgi:predicted nucleotidyltransferase
MVEAAKMVLAIEIPEKKIEEFCKRNRVRKLSIFGSVLRDDFNPESDIDILVEFDDDATPGFFRLMRMQDELTEMLGRSVDLRTPKDLSRYFRDDVVNNAVIQYVEG